MNNKLPDTLEPDEKQFERIQNAWLITWVALALAICFSPVLFGLLAKLRAWMLDCASVPFQEPYPRRCAAGDDTLLLLLDYGGEYGWIVSVPLAVSVLFAALLLYSGGNNRPH